MGVMFRAAALLAVIGLLSACLVTPGKFTSTLDIRADGRFSFTYVGEVIASDADGAKAGKTPPLDDGAVPGQESAYLSSALLWEEAGATENAFDANGAPDEKRMHAIAEALRKEKGFRAARYVGDRRFEIDYAISGRLDHGFVFPFNLDAQIVLPFVAVELRGQDRVRVRAPGFSNGMDHSQGVAMGGMDADAAARLDGSFTLTTDAEIISQNEEDGVSDGPDGRTIRWRVTSLTSDAPAATLKLKP
ncbi:MAG: hypothetical protein ABW164_06940 [Sphingobium sp.]